MEKEFVLFTVAYGDGEDNGLRVVSVRFRTRKAAEDALKVCRTYVKFIISANIFED